jgi:LytS/YehU family sensor histidine kinase
LEKLRLGDRTDIRLEVHGSTFGKQIEPFLFINFIENAFKHGANPSLAKSFIHIDYVVDSERNMLTFSISNTKPTILNDLDKAKVGGIGLKNVQTRLNILYPSRHELKIVDETDKYTVILTLQTI